MSFFCHYVQPQPVIVRYTPKDQLFQAIEMGDLPQCERLLKESEKEISREARNKHGLSPVHVALIEHMRQSRPESDTWVDIIHLLVQSGFPVDPPVLRMCLEWYDGYIEPSLVNWLHLHRSQQIKFA